MSDFRKKLDLLQSAEFFTFFAAGALDENSESQKKLIQAIPEKEIVALFHLTQEYNAKAKTVNIETLSEKEMQSLVEKGLVMSEKRTVFMIKVLGIDEARQCIPESKRCAAHEQNFRAENCPELARVFSPKP